MQLYSNDSCVCVGVCLCLGVCVCVSVSVSDVCVSVHGHNF